MASYPAAAYKKQPGSNGIAKERVPTATLKASKAPPQDLVDGLRVDPKHIPCRFLYDDVGSQLYEQITQLKEYYSYETGKLGHCLTPTLGPVLLVGNSLPSPTHPKAI